MTTDEEDRPCPVCAEPMTQGFCRDCRRRITAAVSEKLARTPGVVQLPSKHLQLYIMRDFVSNEDCDRMMALIDADSQRSTVLGDNPYSDFRTSYSCNLNRENALVQQFERAFEAVLGIDPPFGETIQGQRYAPGQYFKPHHDFFHTSQRYWQVEANRGGQRTWTAMINLNQPEEGGATFFPTAGIRITPRKGNLLIWNNLEEDGWPNHSTLHEGQPVVSGMKYVITKWYRERIWGEQTAPAQPAAAAT